MPRSRWFRITRALALTTLCSLPLVPAVGTFPGSAASAATLPSVSVGDVSISEGTGGTVTAVFTITQDKRGRSAVTYSTANGTATSPADYLARTGTVKFAGKKLTRTVAVTVISDAIDEPDETFFVELTGAKGAVISDGEGMATINDNDPAPSVAVGTSASVPEGQTGDTSFASIDVTLSTASGKQVSVGWTTADGTATVAGSDYTPGSGTLVFAPGETEKVVVIPVIGDDATEGDETFDVDLSAPVNATLGNATDVVTIVDNDPIPLGSAVLTVTGLKQREGGGGTTTFTFTVTRSGETTTAVNVDYATSDGTALASSDYIVASGNLPFAANDTIGTIDVTVNGDRLLEHDETFFLGLLNPSVGAAISTGQATGTIVNDDTRTTANVKVRAAKRLIVVHGRVSPARRGKHMSVRLFRKRNGVWVRIRTRRPILAGSTDVNGDGFTDSRYATRFGRPKAGRCKIEATYPGDAKFSPSKAVRLFRC
jgi:Calx-beta domain-containing protein